MPRDTGSMMTSTTSWVQIMPYSPTVRSMRMRQGNVQQALAAGGEGGGLNPLAHGLEGVADEKVHRRQGHRQAGDAQEGGPQGAGLRLRDEQVEKLGGERREAGHTAG